MNVDLEAILNKIVKDGESVLLSEMINDTFASSLEREVVDIFDKIEFNRNYRPVDNEKLAIVIYMICIVKYNSCNDIISEIASRFNIKDTVVSKYKEYLLYFNEQYGLPYVKTEKVKQSYETLKCHSILESSAIDKTFISLIRVYNKKFEEVVDEVKVERLMTAISVEETDGYKFSEFVANTPDSIINAIRINEEFVFEFFYSALQVIDATWFGETVEGIKLDKMYIDKAIEMTNKVVNNDFNYYKKSIEFSNNSRTRMQKTRNRTVELGSDNYPRIYFPRIYISKDEISEGVDITKRVSFVVTGEGNIKSNIDKLNINNASIKLVDDKYFIEEFYLELFELTNNMILSIYIGNRLFLTSKLNRYLSFDDLNLFNKYRKRTYDINKAFSILCSKKDELTVGYLVKRLGDFNLYSLDGKSINDIIWNGKHFGQQKLINGFSQNTLLDNVFIRYKKELYSNIYEGHIEYFTDEDFNNIRLRINNKNDEIVKPRNNSPSYKKFYDNNSASVKFDDDYTVIKSISFGKKGKKVNKNEFLESVLVVKEFRYKFNEDKYISFTSDKEQNINSKFFDYLIINGKDYSDECNCELDLYDGRARIYIKDELGEFIYIWIHVPQFSVSYKGEKYTTTQQFLHSDINIKDNILLCSHPIRLYEGANEVKMSEKKSGNNMIYEYCLSVPPDNQEKNVLLFYMNEESHVKYHLGYIYKPDLFKVENLIISDNNLSMDFVNTYKHITFKIFKNYFRESKDLIYEVEYENNYNGNITLDIGDWSSIDIVIENVVGWIGTQNIYENKIYKTDFHQLFENYENSKIIVQSAFKRTDKGVVKLNEKSCNHCFKFDVKEVNQNYVKIYGYYYDSNGKKHNYPGCPFILKPYNIDKLEFEILDRDNDELEFSTKTKHINPHDGQTIDCAIAIVRGEFDE